MSSLTDSHSSLLTSRKNIDNIVTYLSRNPQPKAFDNIPSNNTSSMAASDKFQYLQQVKHYNSLIKSLQSSSRNATASFGPDSDQARFCADMLRETMREAENVGVVVPAADGKEAMDVDVEPVAAASGATDEVAAALQELRERLAGVRIG